MTISSPAGNAAWGLFEWAATGVATLLASVGAFVWRLTLRLQAIEATQARQRHDLDLARQASDAAALRLAERLELLLDDHHRLRESVVALPTRADLRSLDEHIAERLDALAARLDRLLDV
ncbi:MAG: hypothetical protein ABSF67_03845 [Roseiarcus sp.]|jgi:hypothetical protein